jgi:hypothetical protein
MDRRRLAEWAEERVTATSSKTRSTELEVLVDRVEEHAVAGEDTELHAMAPRLATQEDKDLPSKSTTSWDAYMARPWYGGSERLRWSSDTLRASAS